MTPLERWAPIAGFPSYEISDLGRIRRVTPARNSKPGRMLKPALRNGYPAVDLCRNGHSTLMSVHRLVAAAFIPNPAALPEINHLNGVRTDARVSNLEWATRRQNAQHAHDNDLQICRGVRNGQAKLTTEAVEAIRAKAGGPRGTAELVARSYGVSGATVRDIWKGRTWPSP